MGQLKKAPHQQQTSIFTFRKDFQYFFLKYFRDYSGFLGFCDVTDLQSQYFAQVNSFSFKS